MHEHPHRLPEPAPLGEWVRDARQRSMDLIADLDDAQLMGPRLPVINPLLWEVGHVAWFQEKWALRHAAAAAPLRSDADALWDSIAIDHDVRWDLPLPTRRETLAYMTEVRDRVLERLAQPEVPAAIRYHVMYAVFHEDMHTEAFTYTRQTLAYPPPVFTSAAPPAPREAVADAGLAASGADVEIPGGPYALGAPDDGQFVFDNERWAHPVELAPFRIAAHAVTQRDFLAFVEDRGYGRRDLWCDEGWAWREAHGAVHPVYWRRSSPGEWSYRHFDRWHPLQPDAPMIHVNWYEASAYCRWAGRRLPTEAEWEAAASAGPDGRLPPPGEPKRRFPWGDAAPTPRHANLDWAAMGCVSVGGRPDGAGPSGCQGLVGNVWEWTASPFLPYPGFFPDPYVEYSQPWFGTRRVMRGGCWATRSRLLRNTLRNFQTPDRRDILTGFRTCALTA